MYGGSFTSSKDDCLVPWNLSYRELANLKSYAEKRIDLIKGLAS